MEDGGPSSGGMTSPTRQRYSQCGPRMRTCVVISSPHRYQRGYTAWGLTMSISSKTAVLPSGSARDSCRKDGLVMDPQRYHLKDFPGESSVSRDIIRGASVSNHVLFKHAYCLQIRLAVGTGSRYGIWQVITALRVSGSFR